MGILHYETAQNTTGSTYCWSSKVTNPAIGICDANGKITYVGCKSSNVDHHDVTIGSVIYRYYYSSSKPTIQAITASGERIYGFNTYKSIFQSHIPAGTYSPSTFKSMIQKYIPANTQRKTRNAFSVTVNGKTYSVPANQEIKYCTTNTAGSGTASTLEIVTFNGKTSARASDAQSFSGTYVVYASNFAGSATFSEYYRFNITVSTDITFI